MEEVQQLFSNVPHVVQTASVATLVFLAIIYISQGNYKKSISRIPIVGESNRISGKSRQSYLDSAKEIYSEGYAKFKDSVFRIANSDGLDSIVVPAKFLPELSRLPDNVLSFDKSIQETMEVKYTKILTEEPIIAHTIKADLTPALTRINPVISAEVDDAIRIELGDCENWTSTGIFGKLAMIVAKVSGRIFVGPELCHDPEYLECGIQYTMELAAAQREIKKMRPFLRPFLASRLPEVRRLRERERIATDFLRPVVNARIEAEKKGEQLPDDMLQWFLNRRHKFDVENPAKLAKLQLGIIFAAIHTTTMTGSNILYTLATTPEYVAPLRQEIRAAMAAEGGVMTFKALQQMEKLDSYMKECNRFFPLGWTSVSRKVLQGITLSNGQYIPAGSNIEIPQYAIYQDNEIFPDSSNFDGFRYFKLRHSGADRASARNQFVSVGEQSLGFGYGRHACPGRFFAANEIKMILARILLEYDIKNPEGQIERWPNLELGRSTIPDPSKNIMFKKVEV